MTTLAISVARTNLPALVNKVNKYLDRVLITVNGKPKAMLISTEEIDSLEETAEILAIPGAKSSIRKGLAQIKQGKGVPLQKLIQSL